MRQTKSAAGLAITLLVSAILSACQPQTTTVVVTSQVEVTREVEVTTQVEVTKQVEVEVPVTQVVEVTVPPEGQRELSGQITLAVGGVVPVPGAPLTARQEAWRQILAQ